MNKLFIDKSVFDFKAKTSAGIISGLKLLSSCGYVLISQKTGISKTFSELLAVENIVFENDKSLLSDLSKSISVNNNKVIVADQNKTIKKFNTFSEVADFIAIPKRTAHVERNTKETKIKIDLDLDGSGKSKIKTGIGFFDHMLDQIARHGNVDLTIAVKGDLHIDEHHTIEDTGIALGEAINSALDKKAGIKRYGFLLPMDESVAQCAIDLGGRTHLNFNCGFNREKVGEFPTELAEEFFAGLARGLKANIFIKAEGKNDHHKIESMFKAFAKSLNEACRIDERSKGNLPTTKGAI